MGLNYGCFIRGESNWLPNTFTVDLSTAKFARGEPRLSRRGSGGGGELAHRVSSRLPPPLYMTNRLLRIVGPRTT
ncbi:hypothetical protein J6590_081682 [Homalodisca vitripennis]|nr:hypothetical protein J6590_081682 [Homalodisca vitripennis]